MAVGLSTKVSVTRRHSPRVIANVFCGHTPNTSNLGESRHSPPFASIAYNGSIMTIDIPAQIVAELGNLPPDRQRRVLEYVRSLRGIGPGMSIDQLRKHIGSIDPEEGKAMRDAIETGCEQVNLDEW